MNWDEAKPWRAPAKSLVLYCPKGRWRFAIYNEAGIVDGALDLPPDVGLAEARATLLRRVEEETGLTYTAAWRCNQPDWWSADLTVIGVASK